MKTKKFNFGFNIQKIKRKPITSSFKMPGFVKPTNLYVRQNNIKPRYIGKKIILGKVPSYKRNPAERRLIRRDPWGDRDRDLVPNWIDCKPLDKNRQGRKNQNPIYWIDSKPKNNQGIKKIMSPLNIKKHHEKKDKFSNHPIHTQFRDDEKFQDYCEKCGEWFPAQTEEECEECFSEDEKEKY